MHLAPEWVALTEKIGTPSPHKLTVDTQRFEHFYSKLYRVSRGFEPCDLEPEDMKDILRKANWLFYHTIGSAGWHRKARYYQSFVEKVLTRPGVHCIISFNADTLLDDRLHNLCHSFVPKRGDWERKKELEWTYGIKFGVRHDIWDYEFRDDAKILYCKPHGSLHWGLHRKTGQVSLHHPMESCNSKKLFLREDRTEDALVIPPTEEKELPSPLREVWKRALETMSRAKELCVIGYSAPATDNKEAVELFGSAAASLGRVVIANRSESDRRHIRHLLGNPSKEKVIEYGCFKEYLEKEFREVCAV